jgi:hypothetical protein
VNKTMTTGLVRSDTLNSFRCDDRFGCGLMTNREKGGTFVSGAAKTYLTSDPVKAYYRFQNYGSNNEGITEWEELPLRTSPRYALDKKTTFELFNASDIQKLNSFLQIQFAFESKEKYVTSWFPYRNQQNHYLQTLTVTMQYLSGRIKNVHSEASYHSSGANFIHIIYHWEQFGDEDYDMGLGFLLIFPCLLSMVLLLYILSFDVFSPSMR